MAYSLLPHLLLFTLWLAAAALTDSLDLPHLPSWYRSPRLPAGLPQSAPDYMVDNQGNTHGTAPDKGSRNGPVLPTKPEAENAIISPITQMKSKSSDYWFANVPHGQMPLAEGNYRFYRNVKDFGAVGDGVTDDTEAINRAASVYSHSSSETRCGEKCGSTTTTGAVVYFPPGTYLISSPVIQYYYTQFIGNVHDVPVIKGTFNFTGIALFSTDVYIPGGNGSEWYINQNQFFRTIKNFHLDMTEMDWKNYDHDQEYVPTGIHWQVAQATSLQKLSFDMPVSTANQSATAVGIFMENGSGGFLSDLTFFGGNIGFRAGSQQYTARNLKFTSCLTAISMIWDWGFLWKDIYVDSCYVALDCTNVGGIDGQGTGSVTVLDSHFQGVPYAITLRNGGPTPNIVLDNLLVENSASIVLVSGGETIFEGSDDQVYFNSWAMGRRYTGLDGEGSYAAGLIDPAPKKPASLLDSSGKIFSQPKPQYEDYLASDFVVATSYGCNNDGKSDQSAAINKLLKSSVGNPVFFPAGIYLVKDTIFIPVGSIIVGEAWSQIMATGDAFQDLENPRVVARVGHSGDSGTVQISEMLFTTKGPTPGAILMEWNIHQDKQGSAAMWDSHFRIGGAAGTDLQLDDCPKSAAEANKNCMAATMLLHVTPTASGYFENLWAWVADHDIDMSPGKNATTTSSTQISVYGARGVLIESQGPCWFYGTASEHNVFYQYELSGARDIFMGHMQTETPYFQPNPDASQPYPVGLYANDPTFKDCEPGSYCEEAWALRILNSRDILLYTAGFYSFFSDYSQSCLNGEHCQQRLVETSYTEGLWIYNIFTIGASEIVSPLGSIPPTLQSDDNQSGFSTEVSAWLVLALQGSDIGSSGDPKSEGDGVVYIDPTIFVEPSPTMQCWPPCTLVIPPSPMPAPTVVAVSPVSATVKVGSTTVTTTISEQPITTSTMRFSNMPIGSSQTEFSFAISASLKGPPVTITAGGATTVLTPELTPSGPLGPSGPSGPLSTSAGITTSTGYYYTLPSTVVTSDGITETFSEAQWTFLRTLTTTSTTTTGFTASSSGSTNQPETSTSTGTIAPVWIAPGGFYWSPIPVPGPTPFPLPNLPDPPPVPSPPCFTFLDIFSIDCPPDKSKPTSTFRTGPPSPSCSENCGTGPSSSGSNDEQSTSTSTCATETNTHCRTICSNTPCTTSCTPYVGCACPITTVTDYWVSCSFTSCTTTSSSVDTGCYMEATATTTGDYCPTGITIDPDFDQGGGDGVRTSDIATTTIEEPGEVILGGSTYTMTSDHIVVDGHTESIPTITAKTIVTIDGSSATAIPGYTVSVINPTNVHPSRTDTTSTPTTSAMPTPTASGMTATLGVVGYGALKNLPAAGGFVDLWAARDYIVSKSTTWSCLEPLQNAVRQPATVNVHDYPSSWAFSNDIHGYTSCTYLNSDAPKAAVGTLTCPDFPSGVPCPTATATHSCVVPGGSEIIYDQLFYCVF